nr:MAG TPA: hypothetical protein [Caudoviricetes sp.]
MILRSRMGSEPSDRYTDRLSLLLEMPVFAARDNRSSPRRTIHTLISRFTRSLKASALDCRSLMSVMGTVYKTSKKNSCFRLHIPKNRNMLVAYQRKEVLGCRRKPSVKTCEWP